MNYFQIILYIFPLVVQNKNNYRIILESQRPQCISRDTTEISHLEIWIFIVMNVTQHLTITHRYLLLRIIIKFALLLILYFRKYFIGLCQVVLTADCRIQPQCKYGYPKLLPVKTHRHCLCNMTDVDCNQVWRSQQAVLCLSESNLQCLQVLCEFCQSYSSK